MHECYDMQILETKRKTQKKTKNNGHKEKAMKYKDHDKKT